MCWFICLFFFDYVHVLSLLMYHVCVYLFACLFDCSFVCLCMCVLVCLVVCLMCLFCVVVV